MKPPPKQFPFPLKPPNNAKITIDGGLREQAGYGDALKENWDTTKNIVTKSTRITIKNMNNNFSGLDFNEIYSDYNYIKSTLN